MNNGDFGETMFTPQQARKYSGLTLQKVADKMGVSLATYFNKEHGKRPFTVQEAINFAKIVGIPFENIKWN